MTRRQALLHFLIPFAASPLFAGGLLAIWKGGIEGFTIALAETWQRSRVTPEFLRLEVAETPTATATATLTPRPTATTTPSPTPTATSTSTPSQPAAWLATSPDVRILDIAVVCSPLSSIVVEFDAPPTPPGFEYWALLLPEGHPRYFPSFRPMWDGDQRYHARVYIGDAPWYEVWLLVAPMTATNDDGVIGAYIKKHLGDGVWDFGIDWPANVIWRVHWDVPRRCGQHFTANQASVRFATPTPVTGRHG